jgi:RimJ/RimL family protein N-acetyltransferase
MFKLYHLQKIETPRLIIRPVQPGDEVQINKAILNTLKQLQQWMPWANDPSIATTRKHVQQGVYSWLSESVANFPMVVIHKEDEKIIACSGFNERSDLSNGSVDIGYWCDADYQGQGYVTEYVNALTRYALDELKLKTVHIRTEVSNKKSMAVTKRLSFKNEGERPSATKEGHTDYLFTRSNTKQLPDIKISFTHEKQLNGKDIMAWAKESLSALGYTLKSELPECVKYAPWSQVIRVATTDGALYLKHTPELLALEAPITKTLHDKFHAPVPKVIAHNSELHCFLMKDAGQPLRQVLKQEFNSDLFCNAINGFIDLQSDVADHVDTFLDMGVPDWRLEKLPDLYRQLLQQKKLLMNDGLSAAEINKLEELSPTVVSLCDRLSQYPVQQTLVQSDFHDNNILVGPQSKKITFIDLGEIVISHPFFSLLGCLWQARKHHSLAVDSEAYQKLEEACFKRYKYLEKAEILPDAIEAARLLWPIHDALAQYRLITACDKDAITGFQPGKISHTLKEFIDFFR